MSKIIAKCTAYDPQERYQTIDELRKAIIRSRMLIPSISVATLAIAITAITLLPISQIRIENLKKQYHTQLDPQFFKTLELISKLQYKEIADFKYNHEYHIKTLLPFMDSLHTSFPMSETGEIAPQIHAICAVFREYSAVYDSIVNKLPSMDELPYKRQRAIRDSLRSTIKP